jgi:hypothetical protein
MKAKIRRNAAIFRRLKVISLIIFREPKNHSRERKALSHQSNALPRTSLSGREFPKRKMYHRISSTLD